MTHDTSSRTTTATDVTTSGEATGTPVGGANDAQPPIVVTDEGAPIVVERRVEVPVTEHRSRVVPFLAGVLTTLAAAAIGLGVFLAVSDSDDDGNIELDVPAVDVRIDE